MEDNDTLGTICVVGGVVVAVGSINRTINKYVNNNKIHKQCL